MTTENPDQTPRCRSCDAVFYQQVRWGDPLEKFLCYTCYEKHRDIDRKLGDAESVFDALTQEAVNANDAATARIAFEAKTKTALLRMHRKFGVLK